jgi:hypothetical protein
MPHYLPISAENRARLDLSGAQPFAGYAALAKYSDQLKGLVARCLNWEQEHRPDLATLRREIDAFLRDHEEVRDATDQGPMQMVNVEEGLGVGEVFVRKRRVPVTAGQGVRKNQRKGDGDSSED